MRTPVIGIKRAAPATSADPPAWHISAKALEGQVKAVGDPTPGDLEAINQYALVPLKAAEVAVYTMRVANDQLDRDGERFGLDVLQDFASSLPGKALLEGHRWGPVGIGRFFAAWLANEEGVNWLMAKAYLLREDPAAAEMIVKLNGGVATFVSIGFYAPQRVEVVDQSGNITGEYRRGMNGEPAEALEASLVFLGSQYDAEVVRKMAASLAAKYQGAMATERREGFMSALGRLFDRFVGGPADMKTTVSDSTTGPAKVEPAIKDAEPAAPAAAAEEQTMTREQVEEIVKAALAEAKAEIEALRAKVAEAEAKMAALGETIGTLDGRVKAIEDGVTKMEDDVAEFGEKVLGRVEGIEGALGMSRAAVDGDSGGGDAAVPAKGPAPQAGKKSNREIFGDMFRFPEWTGKAK